MSACLIFTFLKTGFLNAPLYLGEVIKHFTCSVCACVGAGARFGLFMLRCFLTIFGYCFLCLYSGGLNKDLELWIFSGVENCIEMCR